jgi:4-azaleucine resistance transporter AzlC
VTSRKKEFWKGMLAEAPILLGVAPFGLLYGALAMDSGLDVPAAQAMSSILFAGSAQLVAVRMIGAGLPPLAIILVVFVVNLRHALYSASIAPHVRHLSPSWKLLLAYLLTDEAYAVTITHYQQADTSSWKHWYFLGAGLTLWAAWQASTAIGIFIGARIPPGWPLGFLLPLTFIALVVPALKDRAGILASIVAALVGLLTIGFPFRLGLLLAAFLGIQTGMLVEGRRK